MEFMVTRISDGLGIGEGSISGVSIANNVGEDVMQRADAAISSSSILVDVGTDDNGAPVDDDGCGDGRITKVVMKGREPRRRSLNRAKVFGGGSAMAVADLIGSGEAADTLVDTFGKAINILSEHMIDFGAHTAEHVSSEDKSGCGAIDEAPTILNRVIQNQAVITEQLRALGIAAEGLDVIFENFKTCNDRFANQAYRGLDVMNLIVDRGKIVKQLGGAHVEARIILNYVPGKTIDQGLIHSVSDGKVDVFGVDVWRIQDLAKGLHSNDEQAELHALQSMLVYTLAVAIVLTKGDLPVYTIKPAAVRASAPVAA